MNATDTGAGRRKVADQPVTPDVDSFAERVRVLPVEDKADLLDLFLALPGAFARKDQEDTATIMRTVMDILSGKREDITVVSEPLPQSTEAEAAAQPKHWKQFISDRIVQMRTERGWTQEQLAERTGLTQSHISRIERMQHSPSRKTVEKIANAFGVKVGDLDPSEL